MAVAMIISGCGNHAHENEEEHEHEEHAEHAEKGHEGEIVVSPERQKTLGIATDTVKLASFSEVIHTSGKILSAAGDEMTVVAKSDGIVSTGSLVEGSAVGRGSRIATISSKGIGSGDQLAKASIAFETARKEYERDLELRKDNIVSESHLDRSKMEYEQTKAEYEALSSGGATSGGIAVTSPIAGFVKSLKVSQGDYVTTGQPIATVSSNRRLQLRAEVSEKYYGMIGRITDANFTTSYSSSAFSLKDLDGKLLGYGRASEGDCFIPVTFEFDNKGDIVPGTYADIFLKTSSEEQAIAVPVEAVVEDQGVRYVFVQHEPDSFLKKEVTLGQSDGEMVRILSGIKPGDLLVVKGAMDVKLASVTAVPAGHTHNH